MRTSLYLHSIQRPCEILHGPYEDLAPGVYTKLGVYLYGFNVSHHRSAVTSTLVSRFPVLCHDMRPDTSLHACLGTERKSTETNPISNAYTCHTMDYVFCIPDLCQQNDTNYIILARWRTVHHRLDPTDNHGWSSMCTHCDGSEIPFIELKVPEPRRYYQFWHCGMQISR